MHLLRHNAPVSQQRRDGGDDKAGGGVRDPWSSRQTVTRSLGYCSKQPKSSAEWRGVARAAGASATASRTRQDDDVAVR
jgi:hypothetical protein